MGFPMADCKVGSLVWVQRKNGTWWPGRILSPSKISSSHHFSSLATSKTPIKLLGRENGSVEWFNLETSKRIKSFRCGDFDDSIRRAESSQASACVKDVRYAHRENAILHALQLEKQEQGNRHKRPVATGEVQQGWIFRAKRSRRVYSDVESHHDVELPVLHSQSLKLSPSASATVLAAENSTSGPPKSDFSVRDPKDSNGDGMTQPHGHAELQLQKQKLREDCSIMTRNKMRHIKDLLMEDPASQQNSKYGFEAKSGKNLAFEDNMISHSTWGENCSEDSNSIRYGSQCVNHQSTVKIILVDVEIEVLTEYRKEHVPLVCLMSRLNKKAIIGHPIEIEALHGNSEVSLVRKNHFHDMLDDDESRINQLTWRTSKRSPVSYISKCYSSPKEDKGEEACKNSDGSSCNARRDDFFRKENISSKVQKKASFAQRGSGKESLSREEVTCVPLDFIFTNLLLAVGSGQS